MAGRSDDLDAALAQLESTVLDLTGNRFFFFVIMAHAFARAGYAPGARPKRLVAVEAERRNGLRVLDGGKSRVTPTLVR